MTFANLTGTLKTLIAAHPTIETSWIFTDDDDTAAQAEAWERTKNNVSPGVAIILSHLTTNVFEKAGKFMGNNRVLVTVCVNPKSTHRPKEIISYIMAQVMTPAAGVVSTGYKPEATTIERESVSLQSGMHVYSIFLTAVTDT